MPVMTILGLLLTNCIVAHGDPKEIFLNQSRGSINLTETFLNEQPSSLNWIINEDDSALTKISFGSFNLERFPEISLKICGVVLGSRNCSTVSGPNTPDKLLRGRIDILLNLNSNTTFKGLKMVLYYQYQCETVCGSIIQIGVEESKLLRRPTLKYHDCSCRWLVSITVNDYVVRAEFLRIRLPAPVSGECEDKVEFKDISAANKISGPYCGSTTQLFVSSGNQLQIDYVTRNIFPSEDFEILITAKKKEGDLAGLQSVAAVLGAISFGVFIGLMACSVLYKRWSQGRNSDINQNIEEENGDGCEDAIQRAAPPSYDIVVAAPKDYPSTPQASPIMTRTLPTVQPPEYPGLRITEQPRSRSSSSTFPVELEMSTLSVPILPSYDVVSESEDEWFPVHTSPGQRTRSKSKLVGENGNPPSYQAVTSEGSDLEMIGNGSSSNRKIEPRTQNRTSRSKRDSLSLRNRQHEQLQQTHSDSDSDNEEGKVTGVKHTTERQPNELIVPNHELPAISSDSEGEAIAGQFDSTDTGRRLSPPPNNLLTVFNSDRIASERRPSDLRERTYSEIARLALQKSHTIATSPEASPTMRRNRTAPNDNDDDETNLESSGATA